MLKKISYILTLIILLIPTSIHANEEVGSIAKNWFTTFSKKISLKYTLDKEILYFEGFTTKLNELVAVKDFNDVQIDLVNDLIRLSNENIFKLNRYKEENSTKIILKTNSLLKDFKKFSYNKEHIFLENGVRYTYKFDYHLTFPKGSEIKKDDLLYNGINTNKTLVFLRDDNALGFVNNYIKVKLISENIIYGIPGKYNFLKEIKDDKKTKYTESDNDFINLKNIAKELTVGKKESDKIKIIYDYILDSIEYPLSFSLSDSRIFSGIDTFTNKLGVCEGYTKILLYMLNFAGINNSEIIRGYVIDAQDFPKIGHAWIKIGDKYYDPTFDDPIGQTATKKLPEYKFFGLPYDLFYTNRYTFEKLPSFLKEENSDFLNALVAKKIAPMVYKYRYSGYNILKPFTLKLDYGINLEKKLDIEDLKIIMTYYEVDNFKFLLNGVTKSITTLKYYNLEDLDIESIIEQLNFTFNGYYLFKWKLVNGNYEYRLAYDVELK
ncbi:MAG: hypothetical protein QM490_02805 [Candidatus Gracilibacteria bacterium]